MERRGVACNGWETYRPTVVMTEHHQEMSPTPSDLPICRFLEEKGYRLISKLPNELIFLRNDCPLNKSGMIAP